MNSYCLPCVQRASLHVPVAIQIRRINLFSIRAIARIDVWLSFPPEVLTITALKSLSLIVFLPVFPDRLGTDESA